MQLPRADASSEVHLAYADHFEGATEGWADAENISATQRTVVVESGTHIKGLSTSLRKALATREQAERDAARTRAKFVVRDAILDLRFMALSDAVLNGPAHRNRNAPEFNAVFQENPSDTTRGNMREEPEIVATTLERFDKLDEFDGKAVVRAPLATALDKSLTARDALDAAESVANKTGDEELACRMALRQGLEQVYGKLRAAFPGRRDFVESFFLKRAKSGKDEPQPGGEA